jgi:hypothetical protein
MTNTNQYYKNKYNKYLRKMNGGNSFYDFFPRIRNIQEQNSQKINNTINVTDNGNHILEFVTDFRSLQGLYLGNMKDPYQLSNGNIFEQTATNQNRPTREHIIAKKSPFFNKNLEIIEERNKNNNTFLLAFKHASLQQKIDTIFAYDINMIIISQSALQHFKGESIFSEIKIHEEKHFYDKINSARNKSISNLKNGNNISGEKIPGIEQCYKNSVMTYNPKINFNHFYIDSKILFNYLWNVKTKITDCLPLNGLSDGAKKQILNQNENENLRNLIVNNFSYNIDRNLLQANTDVNNRNMFIFADPIVFINPINNGLKVIISLAYLYFHITYKNRMNHIINPDLYDYMINPEIYIKWLLPDDLLKYNSQDGVNIINTYRDVLNGNIFYFKKVGEDHSNTLKNPFIEIIKFYIIEYKKIINMKYKYTMNDPYSYNKPTKEYYKKLSGAEIKNKLEGLIINLRILCHEFIKNV